MSVAGGPNGGTRVADRAHWPQGADCPAAARGGPAARAKPTMTARPSASPTRLALGLSAACALLLALLAAISLLALLITLIAALDVIVPGPYRIRRQSLSDQAGAWERMLRRKRDGLRAAAVSFGIGLSAFATLIAALLYVRWLG